MVPQHRHARQPLDAHDDLEGQPEPCKAYPSWAQTDSLREHPQSKLATLRNANSEDEVDDSMLQLGLMAYPVLQAADILLYK